MAWSPQYPINFAPPPGGDTTSTAIEKFMNELTQVIFPFLNRIRIMDAGDTPPTDPVTNCFWLDTSAVSGGGVAVLKRYNGTEWIADLAIPNADYADLAGDSEKLDGNTLAEVIAAASGGMNASEILTSLKTVDGSGSGLDADLLDGKHASSFALSSHSHSNYIATSTSTTPPVGSYIMAFYRPDTSGSTLSDGATTSGSNLEKVRLGRSGNLAEGSWVFSYTIAPAGTLAGSWKNVTGTSLYYSENSSNINDSAGLFVRYA